MAIVKAKYQDVAWVFAGFFVFVAVLLSIRLIRSHLTHFTQPKIQSKIVGILWMVPIYAIDSWMSLRFKDAALYLDLCRDCYEAYVIYLFLALMIAYLESDVGEENVIALVKSLPPLEHPPPFNRFNPPIIMGREFLQKCKHATIQFVLLKPLSTVAAIILQANNLYDEGHFRINRGYLYITLLMNASISYAFYHLVLFYLALGPHLAPFSPIPKFLCIKAVLFLSFWQGVLLAFLARFAIIHDMGKWTSHSVSTGIQNLLICVEMCAASVAHQYAFPITPFVYNSRDEITYNHPGNNDDNRSWLRDNFSLSSAIKDFNEVISKPSSEKPVMTPRSLSNTDKELMEESELLLISS